MIAVVLDDNLRRRLPVFVITTLPLGVGSVVVVPVRWTIRNVARENHKRSSVYEVACVTVCVCVCVCCSCLLVIWVIGIHVKVYDCIRILE